jgi:integrase
VSAESKKPLVDAVVRAAPVPAPGKRVLIWDSYVGGFALRITDKGARSFVVIKRMRGERNPIKFTVAPYPADAPIADRHKAISDARDKAKEILTEIAAGRDPRLARDERRRGEEAARRAEADAATSTFGAVAERVYQLRYSKKRTAKNIKSVIDRILVARWGQKQIADVTRVHVVDMLEETNTKSPSTARQARIYGMTIFDWACNRGTYGIATSPFYGVKAKLVLTKLEPRNRILSPREIPLFWQATESDDPVFNPWARLLLILGSREGETANMLRTDLDLRAGVWGLPPEDGKNGERRLMPLPPLALEILRALPVYAGPFVFSTTNGRRPISGFSKFEARLRARINALAGEAGVPHFMTHDIRRTMRTNLSALPIDPVVRELLIGHKKQGLHKVYDLYSYWPEKVEGLTLWNARLASFIDPASSNIAHAAAARAA